MPEINFEILYQDDSIIAINKPSGILVHLTRLSEDTVSVVQALRAQLGDPSIYPVHRLDRATSGVLLFARSVEVAGRLGATLMDKIWEKRYYALVRGFIEPAEGTIDHPLTDPETGKHEPQSAVTHYRLLAQVERPWPIGLRYPTARFSWIEAIPETGRRHQIRKHLSHIRYPIVGDSRHGDVKIKRYFREQGWPERMMLHAHALTFPHPADDRPITLEAAPDAELLYILEQCGLNYGP